MLLSFIVLLAFAAQAFAENEEPAELFTRYEHYSVSYYLNEDGSQVESHDWARTVLKEAAVAGAKQAAVTYSTSIEKAEVLEAYTRKADGRRPSIPI